MKEKYIEMFGAEGKKLGEVRFDGKRIFTKPTNPGLQSILDTILEDLPKDLSKAFNLIPDRTAHYSRLFFGDIKEGK